MGKTSISKLSREQAKRDKREYRDLRRMERKEKKHLPVPNGGEDDPDLAGMTPGPQPKTSTP